jgi:hypothetical protein
MEAQEKAQDLHSTDSRDRKPQTWGNLGSRESILNPRAAAEREAPLPNIVGMQLVHQPVDKSIMMTQLAIYYSTYVSNNQ